MLHLRIDILDLFSTQHNPSLITIDKIRWGSSLVWAMCFVLIVRGEKTGVEYIVNLPLFWEDKAVCNRSHDLFDYEGSLLFRCEFP